MKKTYSTIIVILGIGLGGFLFAQQSAEPEISREGSEKEQPDVRIHVQKELDEDGNIIQVDSSYSWNWSGDEQSMEDIQDKLMDFFEDIGDGFSFHFKDSTIFPQGFHEFFQEDFNQKLEDLQGLNEKFDEQYLERFNEKLEKLQDKDFQFKLDENFNQHLEQGWQRILEKWQEFYQDHQQELNQHGKKAL